MTTTTTTTTTMKRALRATLLSLAAATVAACSPVTEQTVVRERASSELACRPEQVQVTFLSGSLYRAAGCSKEALYSCVGEGRRIKCTPEEQAAHPVK